MKLKKLLTICLVAMGVFAANAADVDYSTGEIKLGEWNTNYDKAKAYAEENNIPLIAYWGESTCAWCSQMINNGLRDDEFKKYQKARKLVMVYYHGANKVTPYKQWIMKNAGSDWPFMAIYWKKADGTVVEKHFTGRTGRLITSTEAKNSTVVANTAKWIKLNNSKQITINKYYVYEELIALIEKYINAYGAEPAYKGGTFCDGTGSSNTLEVAISDAGKVLTTNMTFRLTRKTKGIVTNSVVFAGTTKDVVWGKNDTSKSVTISVPTGAKNGTTYKATIYDKGDTKKKTQSTATVVCTNRANSISYPYWLGERTAANLKYGEWTMDLAVAKQKAKNDSGYVLMNLGGDLWCPDCVSAADSLYADAKFTKWSQDNKVALVAVDVPRSLELEEASLLTYTAGGTWNKSGAFYRSSKMITDSAAKKQLTTNWLYATNTYKLASSSGWRVSVPVMVLLKSDGSVVGHFMAKEGGTKNSEGLYTYDTTENIARLNELLAMVNQDGGKDNEAHRDSSTTKLTHKVGGTTSDTLTLQINDNAWFYKLSGLAAGQVAFTAETDANKPAVSLELFTSPSGRYGDDKKVTVASGTGVVYAEIDAATIKSDVYLRVSAYPNATGSDTQGKDTYSFAGTSSLFGVTLSSAIILVPEQVSQSVTPTGTNVYMRLVKGTSYKLSGIAEASLTSLFTKSGELYVAKESNDAACLDVASGVKNVMYQIWKPGTVQFSKASDRKMEADGRGTITVTRTGGVSGAINVRVSMDAGARETGRAKISVTSLSWSEGDSSTKTITYTIDARTGYDVDEVFKMTLAADDASVLGKQKTFALTVSDTDKPVLESDAITINAFYRAAVSKSYTVYNIQGNGKLTLKKSGKLPSGMKIAYDKDTRRVVVSGTPKATGTYTVTTTLKEKRSSGYAEGPSTTFKIVVRDPSSASSMAGYGVANSYYCKALSQDVPLINQKNNRMEGTLTVSISKSNRVTAKYVNLGGKKTSFKGAVNEYDIKVGDISATLAKNGSTCEVIVSPQGTISAEVYDAERKVTLSCEEIAISTDAAISKYVSSYTVTFPRASTSAAEVAAGTAYVTMTINAKGVVKYSGLMPNGTKLSGSADVIAGSKYALVPIFKIKSGNTFSALLSVAPNAQKTYEDGNPAIIEAEDNTVPFWTSTEDISTTEELKAYGGYYSGSLNIEDACHELYSKSVFTVDFGLDDLDWTGSSAAVTEVPTADVKVTNSSLSIQSGDGVTIKLASKTGIVSGKATLTLANGKTTKATFKGIVLLGWEDCNCGETAIVPENRPFVSGTCYFNDTVDGVKVTRSIPVDLNVKVDCDD